uniref:Uncharacterized protein n=1 Tax=Crocodylus porosus TaxID=8502 RepID=A0A7M4FDX5_CROPO
IRHFIPPPPPWAQKSKKTKYFSAQDPVRQLFIGMLHADGGKLKNRIDRHLKSELFFKRTAERSLTRREATFALVEALMAADIPLEKTDNPRLRDYLNKYVPNTGSFPCPYKLHQHYLPGSLLNWQDCASAVGCHFCKASE